MASTEILAAVNRGIPLAAAIAWDSVVVPNAATATVISAAAPPAANAVYTQADLTTLLTELAEIKLDFNAMVTDVANLRTVLTSLVNTF